jgi:hypothetical protein
LLLLLLSATLLLQQHAALLLVRQMSHHLAVPLQALQVCASHIHAYAPADQGSAAARQHSRASQRNSY